ncbi:hypothetical protein BC834DRAFT_594777 [Gloeopeniophorella convolvens]|nr:hypothetical protein BC834DRAFT_594777 [Gloeopeniophorella convolvens]
MVSSDTLAAVHGISELASRQSSVSSQGTSAVQTSHEEESPSTLAPSVHTRRPEVPASACDAQAITVHQFLNDVTSRANRTYCHRKPVVDLGAYKDGDQGPGPAAPPVATLTPHSDSEGDHVTPTPSPPLAKISKNRASRPRRKRLSKSLAQRLFEADVFSSGTSYKLPSEDAHTSSRRPLPFATGLSCARPPTNDINFCREQPDHEQECPSRPRTNFSKTQGSSGNTAGKPRRSGPFNVSGPGKTHRSRSRRLTRDSSSPESFRYPPLPLVWVDVSVRPGLDAHVCKRQ